MEIANLDEKSVSNEADRGARNNVVDFDFLFEFSPERRTEPELRFEQDQVGQQGGEQQQTGGSGGRSRRAEVRPYPAPDMSRIFATLGILFLLSWISAGSKIPEHIFNDPTFIDCVKNGVVNPSDYADVMASCYSFVGRPRFGKRFDPKVREFNLPRHRKLNLMKQQRNRFPVDEFDTWNKK